MVGLDCSIIMNPKVWEASGHVGGFSDPMADCKKCNGRFRADQLVFLQYDVLRAGEKVRAPVFFFGSGSSLEVTEQNAKKLAKLDESLKPDEMAHRTEGTFATSSDEIRSRFECPTCKEVGTLTEPRNFNLMFESHAGAIANEANKVYLRPETAQGIFVNFKNVVDTGRVKIPFGIAQIGKSFRNEINPRNFIFRSREFEQMEIEFFCHPSEAKPSGTPTGGRPGSSGTSTTGLQSDRLRLRDHDPDELAFYSTATADIEYSFPFGVSELEGIAHRGDYDLSQHQKFSGKDLTYFDEEKKERYLPHVIEPSAGADRATLAFPLRGVPGRPGRRRDPDGPQVPPEVRADQGRRVPAGQARRDARDGREDLSRPEASLQRLPRRKGGDRPPIPSTGRGRDAVGDHRRRPDHHRRNRDIPRPR